MKYFKKFIRGRGVPTPRFLRAGSFVALFAAASLPAAAIVVNGGSGNDTLVGGPAGLTVQSIEKLIHGQDANGNPVEADGPAFVDGYPLVALPRQRLSADGKKLVFGSAATNLVPGFDPEASYAGYPQIYIKDMKTGANTLVSTGADGLPGDSDSYAASFSPDGKKVVFISGAENIVDPGKPLSPGMGIYPQVVVKDLTTGSYTVLSRSRLDPNGLLAEFHSNNPAFSPDGQLVTFYGGSGLVDSTPGLYVVRYTGASDDYKSLAKLEILQAGGGHAHADHPTFSPDGQSIAFWSQDDLFIPGWSDQNPTADIFVKSFDPSLVVKNGPTLLQGPIALISVDANGNQGKSGSTGCSNLFPVFAPDGQSIAFRSSCPQSAGTGIRYGLLLKQRNANGGWAGGALSVLSSAADGTPGDDISTLGNFSPDGTKFAFYTYADNIAGSEAPARVRKIIVKDLLTGQVSLVASLLNEPPGVGQIFNVFFAPDSASLVFAASADTLKLADGSYVSNLNPYMMTQLFLAKLAATEIVGEDPPPEPLPEEPGNDPEPGPIVCITQPCPGEPEPQPDPAPQPEDEPTPSPDDTLTGGAGDDILDGKAGADTMTGGAGDDIYYVDDAGDRVIEYAGGGRDRVNATLSYTLPAHVEDLALLGTLDRDGTGNALGNTLSGNAGANLLSGLAGNDKIEGGTGDDTLHGGSGRDLLTGGPGADRFRFSSRTDSPLRASDTIRDFNPSEGDVIDLSALDADLRKPGNQAFRWIGAKRFSGRAGEARFSRGALLLDLNGDKRPDMLIHLAGKRKNLPLKALRR